MTSEARKGHAARIAELLDYVQQHFEEPLSFDLLSRKANFSRFHFHRQFSAVAGLPLHRLVQLLRLKRAAQRLAFAKRPSITEIALDTGFQNAESFSRAFRKVFGQSPSAFRRAPDWNNWREAIRPLPLPESSPMHVEIVNFPHTPVALLAHRGPESQVYETSRRFIDWRRQVGLPPSRGRTYGLHYQDPFQVLPEDYRMDLCVSYDKPVAPNPQGVVSGTIPAGRCARLRHLGSRDYIPGADWLYREWLPASGEALRDFPFFFHYVNVGPDVRDADMITDLYLPLE